MIRLLISRLKVRFLPRSPFIFNSLQPYEKRPFLSTVDDFVGSRFRNTLPRATSAPQLKLVRGVGSCKCPKTLVVSATPIRSCVPRALVTPLWPFKVCSRPIWAEYYLKISSTLYVSCSRIGNLKRRLGRHIVRAGKSRVMNTKKEHSRWIDWYEQLKSFCQMVAQSRQSNNGQIIEYRPDLLIESFLLRLLD